MSSFSRITFDPAVMGGKACIRNLRVTVGTVVGLLAARRTPEEILRAYPYLERDDIDECLAYAAWRLEERELPHAHDLSMKVLNTPNGSPRGPIDEPEPHSPTHSVASEHGRWRKHDD